MQRLLGTLSLLQPYGAWTQPCTLPSNCHATREEGGVSWANPAESVGSLLQRLLQAQEASANLTL